jgi:hypothetical protein
MDYNLLKIIDNNIYLKTYKNNKKIDKNSLCYLLDQKLQQSDCIKLGIAIEKIFIDIIKNYTDYIDIKSMNIKNKKEKDHLFLDKNNKIVYYAEFKSNLNLDSEKSKITSLKCNYIHKELSINYPEYKIFSFLVGFNS